MTASRKRAGKGEWLVVGHGSVGSFIAARLVSSGASVFVFDPHPRVSIRHGTVVADPARAAGRVEYVVSCVPPAIAEGVPLLVRDGLRPSAIFFDWNTVGPEVKERIQHTVPAVTIDVALLDSVDGSPGRPNLAVSGSGAEEAARVLEERGFNAWIAGKEVGQAATLKYLRSLFMKGLEALVLEYTSLAWGFEGEEIVRASLESNLGGKFVAFMDLLVETNRIHAERRAGELADAVAMFALDGAEPTIAAAAVRVLTRATEAWSETGAPPIGAQVGALAGHLREALWGESAST